MNVVAVSISKGRAEEAAARGTSYLLRSSVGPKLRFPSGASVSLA